MTSQNKPNPDLSPVENVDIDQLLNQVDQMTNRMENLMASNGLNEKKVSPKTPSDNSAASPVTADTAELKNPKETPSPEASAPLPETELDQVKDIEHLDALTSDTAQKIDDDKWDQQESDFKAGETMEPVGNELDPDPAPDSEIKIDERVDSLAEEEINQMLNRLDHARGDSPDGPCSEEDSIEPAVTFPAPIQKVLSIFYFINYPFIWIPADVRDALGYLAIGLLLFGLGLWGFACIFYK